MGGATRFQTQPRVSPIYRAPSLFWQPLARWRGLHDPSSPTEAQGISGSFTIFVGNHTLMTRAKSGTDTPAVEKHSADGKGIDHIFDAYGNQLVEIVIAVGGTPPGP